MRTHMSKPGTPSGHYSRLSLQRAGERRVERDVQGARHDKPADPRGRDFWEHVWRGVVHVLREGVHFPETFELQSLLQENFHTMCTGYATPAFGAPPGWVKVAA